MGLIYHYTRFETFMSYIWPSGTIRSKGLFSSAKEVWGCSCGHGNKLDDTVCSSCSKDKRGFGSDDVKPDPVKKLINLRLQVIEGC